MRITLSCAVLSSRLLTLSKVLNSKNSLQARSSKCAQRHRKQHHHHAHYTPHSFRHGRTAKAVAIGKDKQRGGKDDCRHRTRRV